jgi:hypothetical protein
MKKTIIVLGFALTSGILFSQQNLGVNQPNPTAKTHITNTENQNSLQVDDEDGDVTPFIIDSLGNATVGAKLTTDSLMIPTNASDGAVLTSDANGNVRWSNKEMAIYQDKKLDGTLAGASISGWQIRDLNFTDYESGLSISRTGNIITLQPGTYHIVASSPAFQTNHHKLVIRDNGTNNILKEGTNGYSSLSSGGYTQTRSFIDGVIVLLNATDIVLSHYTQNAEINNGLGTAHADGADEIYTVISIEKIN